MVCKLCQQDRKLCNSHIIPEFFYKALYDEKHRFIAYADDPNQKNEVLQLGIREELLCEDCEQILNKHETYAKQVLYDGLHAQHDDRPDAFVFQGLEYDKFKLFQLSILWRAGISTLAGFRAVTLGPHAETIRKMLIAQNPGEPYQYGCVMFFTRTDMEVEQYIMMMPRAAKFVSHRGFLFLFGGIFWHYIVSKHSHLFPHPANFLSKEGTLLVQRDTEGVAAQILQDDVSQLVSTELQRRKLRENRRNL